MPKSLNQLYIMGSKNKTTILKHPRLKSALPAKSRIKQGAYANTFTTWGQTEPDHYSKTSTTSSILVVLPILIYVLAINFSGGPGDDLNNELVLNLLVSCDANKNQYSSFVWEQILRD